MSTLKNANDRVFLSKNTIQSSGPLYEIFLNSKGGRIHKWHHYFDAYERHLCRYRGKPLRMLEIGVQEGGSTIMWAEYLGTDAVIVGVDIDARIADYVSDRPNIHFRVGDQSDLKFLADIHAEFGPFDIVIDDGGHTANQQITTFNFLYPNMKEDGVFICEDTHTSYWNEYKDRNDGLTFTNYAKSLVDILHSPYKLPAGGVLSRFLKPMKQRKGDFQTTRFTAETHSISFYDSMIVFERRNRSEPFAERR